MKPVYVRRGFLGDTEPQKLLTEDNKGKRKDRNQNLEAFSSFSFPSAKSLLYAKTIAGLQAFQ
jgi:hypothetical protein